MIHKPCPFCCVDNSEDVGGACCFCDYAGDIGIGKGGHFDTIEQYNRVANANPKNKIKEIEKGDGTDFYEQGTQFHEINDFTDELLNWMDKC